MLYTLKKTVETLLAQEHDFLIALKANQGNLFKHLLKLRQEATPVSYWQAQEVSRNRQIQRQVRVYDCAGRFEPQWQGIRSAVCLEQTGTRAGAPYRQCRWFISSLTTSAAAFARLIRGHWHIENRLHWVKDVVLKEDAAPFKNSNAAVNWSICRNIVINLLRRHGFGSMTQALREIAHDIPLLLLLAQ